LQAPRETGVDAPDRCKAGLPVLTATASGSFTVERLLDKMYRQQVHDVRSETPSDCAAAQR
jgi:hypothetical protein